MNFTIDEEYLTDVIINKRYCTLSNPDNPTHEDLIKILRGRDYWTSTSSEDHPEFTKLRNDLEQKNYIRTNRNCWNGDVVLKSFNLNGYKFVKGYRFPCASAMGNSIKYSKKNNLKTFCKF